MAVNTWLLGSCVTIFRLIVRVLQGGGSCKLRRLRCIYTLGDIVTSELSEMLRPIDFSAYRVCLDRPWEPRTTHLHPLWYADSRRPQS